MRRLLLGLAAVSAALVVSGTALADATPVQLVLLYLPDVSNTGTSAASGIAELVMPEGEVRVSAAGLPHLEDPNRYVAWLVNTETNQSLRVASFNTTDSNASVHFENVLPDAIPNKHWNLLLVTVESSAEPTRPSSAHSIAGVFPRSDRDPPPQLLPNTGGGDDAEIARQPIRPEWLPSAGLAALALSGGLGAGYVLGLRKR